MLLVLLELDLLLRVALAVALELGSLGLRVAAHEAQEAVDGHDGEEFHWRQHVGAVEEDREGGELEDFAEVAKVDMRTSWENACGTDRVR